ncbi:MAG: hypothetical protein IT455_10980 [Planctomycetes bacterium]|nr:hypothetical protein [Planctomycetota bacterium]
MAVPLLYLASYYGWLAGGPPTTPELRQVHLVWYFVLLTFALAAPIAGILVFRCLRWPKAAPQPAAAGDERPQDDRA